MGQPHPKINRGGTRFEFLEFGEALPALGPVADVDVTHVPNCSANSLQFKPATVKLIIISNL
jgi:hypothetical protein